MSFPVWNRQTLKEAQRRPWRRLEAGAYGVTRKGAKRTGLVQLEKEKAQGRYLICCLQLSNRRVERRQSQNYFLVLLRRKNRCKLKHGNSQFNIRLPPPNENCQTVEQVAQSGCEIAQFSLEYLEELQLPDPSDLVDLAVSMELAWITSRDSSQPKWLHHCVSS